MLGIWSDLYFSLYPLDFHLCWFFLSFWAHTCSCLMLVNDFTFCLFIFFLQFYAGLLMKPRRLLRWFAHIILSNCVQSNSIGIVFILNANHRSCANRKSRHHMHLWLCIHYTNCCCFHFTLFNSMKKPFDWNGFCITNSATHARQQWKQIRIRYLFLVIVDGG